MRKLPPPQDKLLPILAGHRSNLLLTLLRETKQRQLDTLESRSQYLVSYLAERWAGLQPNCLKSVLQSVCREAVALAPLYTLAKLDETPVVPALEQFLINRGYLLSGFGQGSRRDYRARCVAADAECRQLLAIIQGARAAQHKAVEELASELISATSTIYASARYLTSNAESVTPIHREHLTLAGEAILLSGPGTWPVESALEFVTMTSTPWLLRGRVANGTNDFEQLIHECLILLLESAHKYEVDALQAELRNRERLIAAELTAIPDSRYLSLVLDTLGEAGAGITEAELRALQAQLPPMPAAGGV